MAFNAKKHIYRLINQSHLLCVNVYCMPDMCVSILATLCCMPGISFYFRLHHVICMALFSVSGYVSFMAFLYDVVCLAFLSISGNATLHA